MRKKRVCIIDDDANVREIYLTKFNKEGFDLKRAVIYSAILDRKEYSR